MNGDDENVVCFKNGSKVTFGKCDLKGEPNALDSKTTFPTFEEFCQYSFEHRKVKMIDVYNFFKDRVRPIEWPSDEVDTANEYVVKNNMDKEASLNFVAGWALGISWLKERLGVK